MTKNILNLLFLALVVISFATSCTKNNEVVDNGITTPPAYAKFVTLGADTIRTISLTDGSTNSTEIPIGVTTVSSVDRTIQLTITSSLGSAAGTNYTVPTSIVIPAGQAVDSFEVTGNFGSYAEGDRDTITIQITGGDVPPNSYRTKFYAILFRPCSVDVTNVTGEMEVISDEWGDYVAGDIITVNKIDDTHVSFEYLADNPQPIIIAIDPCDKITSVAYQPYGEYTSSGYGTFSVESVAGSPDNFADLDNKTISVRLEHTVSAGSFGDYAIKLKKVE